MSTIANGLASLIRTPRRRRFRRYRKQLAAQAESASRPDVVSEIGRGGMFVWTERPVELRSLERWSIGLLELGETLGTFAEVVHSHTVPGAARRGLGLRFRAFDEGGETLLIRYLRAIEGGTPWVQ